MSEAKLDAPVTLDQLRVFLCVVEEGSFSKAAKRLRRVQSAVSYSIANLERLLDVELFDRRGRLPKLTAAGRALLPDAHSVSSRVDQLHARARSMAVGVEPRLSLAVDMLFPVPSLVSALAKFRERFVGVELNLHTEALGGVSALVLSGTCQVGISADFGSLPRELSARSVGSVALTPVCGRDHPLARSPGPHPATALSEAVQILVMDRSDLTDGIEHGVMSERRWRVADLASKRALLLSGFGWGHMPTHRVQDDLDRGALIALDADGWTPRAPVPMVAVFRTADPPGPAATSLIDDLVDAARRPPEG